MIVVPYADLTNGKLGTPGGTLSGSLTFQASGAPVKLSGSKCKGGPSGETSRQAKVTAGTITATFDSIGKVVLDTNLNGGYEVPELTLVLDPAGAEWSRYEIGDGPGNCGARFTTSGHQLAGGC